MHFSNRKMIFTGVLAIGLMAALIYQIGIDTLKETLGSVNPLYVVLGFLLYVLIFVLRAIRMNIILEGKVSVKSLLNILFVHNLFNNLLPARIGELSYVYFLKEKEGLPLNYGLSSLMIARIFDIVGIAFLFLISFFVVGDLPELIHFSLMLVGVLLGLIFLFIIMLLYYNEKFLSFVELFTSKTRLDRIKYTKMALEKSEETLENFKIIKSRHVILLSFILSIAIWLIASTMTYMFLQEMSIYLSIWKIFIASGIIVITTILPFHGFGGFGTVESIWTATYVALGVSTHRAIASGVGIHLIIVLYFLILGMIGLTIMKMDETTDFDPLRPDLSLK